MRRSLPLVLAFSAFAANAQINITQVGHLDYQALRNSNLSNLWGYTDETGIEYALVGVNGGGGSGTGGISVVSLEDPANPQEVFFFAGPNSIWREVKTWNDHVYVTTEAGSGGITIVDLSPLPQSTALNAIVWDAPDWNTAHSLFIDENGRLYVHGTDRDNGGVIMYDLTQDPMAPVEVGAFDQWYCHDSFARGDTLYAAHIYDGFFSIVDVSAPASPVLLGTRSTPDNFTHNTWLDASGQYLFTTDERPGSYIAAYDVSDPTDIVEVDRLRSDEVNDAIIHNTYWKDNKLYHSYYTRGIAIYDATNPQNMVEVGAFDTSPFSGSGFNGAWGVYPFFDSGLIIVSDIEQGLFILQPQLQLPCWLEGAITNAQTSGPVNNATLAIVGTTAQDVTGLDGLYATGYYAGGTYTVQVGAPGYASTTVNNVVLANGQVTQLNVQLQPLVAFNFQGMVVTQLSGAPVANAVVELHSPTYDHSVTTNASGNFQVTGMFADDYEITAGRWGWRTVCMPALGLAPGGSPLTIELPQGYYDDFALNLGWTTQDNADSGEWERGVPQGTTNGNTPSNPGADVTGDCGTQAYVTGNGGGAAGTDDIDNGDVTLLSPVFDASGLLDPRVRYKRWFYNGGGTGTPNDTYVIELSNGITTVTVENINFSTPGSSSWQQADIDIASFLTPTASMRLILTATDNAPGHLVEAGLDEFELVFTDNSAVEENALSSLVIWPNPSNGSFNVDLGTVRSARVEVLDATGRIIASGFHQGGGLMRFDVQAETGSYLLRITDGEGRSSTSRLMMVR
ncbi:MAG: choice-of-anchor B family protein [Flavobacteriales bacterium]|nr:choice-of-anchor B family protein [Flavobacteriales bacterium]